MRCLSSVISLRMAPRGAGSRSSGNQFRARGARSRTGKLFVGFLPAISPMAFKAKSERLREMRIHRRTDLTLDDLARWLNPIVGGWMGATTAGITGRRCCPSYGASATT
jgi:hypothetical protein